MTSDRWPEIDRLFHAALALTPDARAAFLDTACAGDDALRREVESLLAHALAAEGFLQRPALHEAAEQLAGDASLSPPNPRIAGYTILRTLGEGGMGVVYLAEQLAPIRRRVALKLIKFGMDTRQVVARFDVERQALALMHHPNIAAVFDAGTTDEGRPYFVMEYVDGAPMTEYCDRHRLSTRARLELFVHVCDAVQHAHQKGVIHRDLKPSNVLVLEQGGQPLPKVIDFGVARAVERSLADRTAFTEAGVMVGTPEYMSPEQAALSDDIDTTTDVYSLGVLLYELLVGALPFDPKMLRAAGYDEMRRMIRESDPIKPSARLTSADVTGTGAASARQTDPGRLTRELRGDLDWITLKALEKDRRLRYATVAAFSADVSHYLADEPIRARPPSATYRMRKFVRRYRGAVLAASALFLTLVVGLTASITQYVRAEGQRAEAEYRAYVATIVAADGELRLNFGTLARQRLLDVPVELRQWEWQHLFLKTDTSLVTLASTMPCAKPGDEYSSPTTVSDNVLTHGDPGTRLYLRRCEFLEMWDGPANVHSTYRATGKIMAVSPSGVALVVASIGSAPHTEWNLRLTDPATSRVLNQFGPFQANPICADISHDGDRLAVGFMPEFSAKGEPMEDFFDIWDVHTGRRLQRLSPKKPPLVDTRRKVATSCTVAFSPDSAWLASSGATVHVWRTSSGTELAADVMQAGTVAQPIAWSGEGSRLAIGRLTGLVDILDMRATPRIEPLDGTAFIRVLPVPGLDRGWVLSGRSKGEVLSIAFSPDGSRVATGTDVTVGVWSVTQKKLMQVLPGHDAQVAGVAFDPAGHIVSADTHGQVKVWPLAASGAVTVLPSSMSQAAEFVLSGNGTLVGVAEMDGGVSAWRLADLHRTILRPGSGQTDIQKLARSIAVSPDGGHVLAAESDGVGTVRSWAVDSGSSTTAAMNESPGPGCESLLPESKTYPVFLMSISPDGRFLAYKQSRCLIVRDLATMKIAATLHEYATSFVFRPDGLLFLVAYDWVQQPRDQPGHARVVVWDWRHNRVQAEVPTPTTRREAESASWRVAISADGRYAAAYGGRPTIVMIWDGDLGHEIGRLPTPAGTYSVAFSPDGHRIATADIESAIRIWDTERRQLVLTLADEDRHAPGLAFTRDGRLIAARLSGGMTIWETKSR